MTSHTCHTSFTTFASGSTGNSSLYICGSARILIDAGTTTKYTRQCLAEIGLGLMDLTHVLITHSHGDHIRGLEVMGKHTCAQLVCSQDTYYQLRSPWQNASVFTPGEDFYLGDCPVLSFPTPHDAPGSSGFVLGQGEGSLGYCTDLGEVTREVFSALRGSQTVFIESNHDIAMLTYGPYPRHLKRRIASPMGHLSNARCAQTVAALAGQGSRRFILGHLSLENNTPALAYRETEAALTGLGAVIGGDVTLSVASAVGISAPVAL